MSLAVRLCIYTIIIQAYIDILCTLYTRDLSIIGRCHPSRCYYYYFLQSTQLARCFWRHCVVLAVATVIFRVQTI